jgi:DNA invertase Pin-like site-specific DNA recombinase
MTAYGYIRKSVVHDPARMLSPETQEAAIRALAARHGDDDVVILTDLDVSGKKRRERRPGWNELLQGVENGEASAVYAYSLSRFARSVSQLAEFFDLCERQCVAVRIDRDHIDTSTATGKLVGNVLASLAQFESDVASERVKDAFTTKRANDPTWTGPGNKPYGALDGEDPMIVVAAFREAGSFDGAARRLNSRGIASRVKGRYWSGSVVRGIVKAHAPDEVGPNVRRGSPAGKRAFRFAQVVACSECGGYLTGSHDQRRGDVRYACARARVIPHARGWVNESKLLPVVRAEAERAALMVRRLQKGNRDDATALAALGAKRSRVIDTYADGHIDRAERDSRLAAIAGDESTLSTRRWVRRVTLPPDIETDDPSTVNAYLRRLFSRAVVDMSQPALRGPSSWVPAVSFDWRDESLRVEGPEDAQEETNFDDLLTRSVVVSLATPARV